MEESKLLERVRRLLAKAEDPGVTEQEAEAYNEKAADLIARYGIDRALLAKSGAIADEITQVSISVDNPYSRDKADLLSFIASALRCRSVLHRVGRSTERVTVFGFKSDLGRVELLYTSLLLQATNQLTRVRPDGSGWDRESTRAYRTSWLLGFRTAVYKRLVTAEQRATNESVGTAGESTALVLVDRKTRVDQAYAEAFPTLGKASKRTFTGSGFSDGHRAGARADIGTTGVGGGRRSIGEA